MADCQVHAPLFCDVLLLCRLWHADVLEWVWFLNSHPEAVYGMMYGDKDSFPLAFHLARKGDIYNQIPTAPSAVLDATPEDVRPPQYLSCQHACRTSNRLQYMAWESANVPCCLMLVRAAIRPLKASKDTLLAQWSRRCQASVAWAPAAAC